MSNWNQSDREDAKPNWLTEEQKRQCFRAKDGWAIPLPGFGVTSSVNIVGQTGGTGNHYLMRSASYIGPYELLVAIPSRLSATGATPSTFPGIETGLTLDAGRYTAPSLFGGTAGQDSNITPYFTTPVTGNTYNYTRGVTAYIPLIVADANMTDLPGNLVISVTGPSNITGFSYTVIRNVTGGTFETIKTNAGIDVTAGSTPPLSSVQGLWYGQSTTLTGSAATGYLDRGNINAFVALNTYGGIGGITQGAAILRVYSPTSGASGSFGGFTGQVFDGRSSAGKTGISPFRFTIV
jgi:hypothetical protein